MAGPCPPFRYGYRIGDLWAPVWRDTLQMVDDNYQRAEAAQPESANDNIGIGLDSPASQIELAMAARLDEFLTKLEDRDRELEDWLEHCSGGAASSLRFATKVVAAHDSLDQNPAHYDYLCAGTNDQDTINTAIAAVAATGGKVLLMEGTYICDKPLAIAGSQVVLVSGVSLEGMGPATILKFKTGFTSPSESWLLGSSKGSRINIHNLTLDVNHRGNVTANIFALLIDGCDHVVVDHIWAFDSDTASYGIQIENLVFDVVITNSIFQDNCWLGSPNAGGIGSPGPQPTHIVIANNMFDHSFCDINGMNQVEVVGNHVWNGGGSQYGIRAASSTYVNIVGNRVEDASVGIVIDNSSQRCHVDGNYVADSQGNSEIWVNDGIDVTVSNNMCSGSVATAGIRVGNPGNPTRAYVHGNSVKGTGHTYGIADYGTSSLIINNDLANGWATAGILNSGTTPVFNLDGSGANWNRLT